MGGWMSETSESFNLPHTKLNNFTNRYTKWARSLEITSRPGVGWRQARAGCWMERFPSPPSNDNFNELLECRRKFILEPLYPGQEMSYYALKATLQSIQIDIPAVQELCADSRGTGTFRPPPFLLKSLSKPLLWTIRLFIGPPERSMRITRELSLLILLIYSPKVHDIRSVGMVRPPFIVVCYGCWKPRRATRCQSYYVDDDGRWWREEKQPVNWVNGAVYLQRRAQKTSGMECGQGLV